MFSLPNGKPDAESDRLNAWNPRHAQEPRAKKSAMPKDVASVVICEACGEHVAEVVVDAKRALCSECHLMESGTRLRREKKTGPED